MPEPRPEPNPAAAVFHGELTGGDAFTRGVVVAGVLAEQSVTALVLRQGTGMERLAVRATNVPGRLADAAATPGAVPMSLESEDATFVVEPARIRWSTSNASLARSLRALA